VHIKNNSALLHLHGTFASLAQEVNRNLVEKVGQQYSSLQHCTNPAPTSSARYQKEERT